MLSDTNCKASRRMENMKNNEFLKCKPLGYTYRIYMPRSFFSPSIRNIYNPHLSPSVYLFGHLYIYIYIYTPVAGAMPFYLKLYNSHIRYGKNIGLVRIKHDTS